MVSRNKHNACWFVIAALFIIPISGAFSSHVWDMQLKTLIVLSVIGSVIGISYLNPKPIIKALICLCALQGVMVTLQVLGLDPLFNSLEDGTKDLPLGFSGSPNQSGLFFAVTSPLVIAFAPWLLPLQLFALFMAKTTSAVIGATVGAIFLNKKLAFALPLVLLLFFIKFENISLEAYKERYNLYKHTVVSTVKGVLPMQIGDKFGVIKANPWLGFGHGNFKKLSPYNQSTWIDEGKHTQQKVLHRYYHAHNDYIEIFFEHGWAGLISVLVLILFTIYRYIRARKTKILKVVTACLIAHSVSALFIFTIHTATSGMLLIIMLGLFYGETRKTNCR